jgi:glycosyltransferase involved in cell wall biosynthesis
MRISFAVWCRDDRAISRTLQRLRQIRRKGDEIIVADLGSQDADIRRALAELPDSTVHLPHHLKISEARNAAMSHATGDIVVSMDADTWVPDGITGELEKTFENTKIDAAVCNVMAYPWVENGWDRAFLKLLNLRFRLAFLTCHPCGRGEFQAFRNVGIRYDSNLHSGEDCEIIARLGSRAVYLNHVTVYESPKRYRVQSHLGTFLMWFRDWFILRVFKRSLPYMTIPKD